MKNLTKRELDVVDLIMLGLSNREISERLYISIHTVKTVIENIFEKLNIHNRVLLALYCYEKQREMKDGA